MQLHSCLRGRKLPVNGRPGGIAGSFRGGQFPFQHCCGGDAPVQALPSQDTEFDLSHVEPTAMLGRIVKLQLLANAVRFRRGKSLIERGGLVDVEIIQHYPDHLGLGVALIDQPLHRVGKILHRSLLRYRYVPPPGLGLDEEKEITGAVAFVFIIIARGLSGLGRQGLAGLSNQLFTALIKIDLRALRIIGLGIQVQHVFHGRHKLPAHLRQTPLLMLPGLEGVFLRIWRTVSRAIESTKPNSTAWSASNCRVQWGWPVGAGVQATAMRWASCLPLSLHRPPGRGRSLSASKFSSTKRWRVRSTVATPTLSARVISSSVRPSSAWSKMRARVSLRALPLPRWIRCSNVVRSSAVSSTTYFFFGIVTGAPQWHWSRVYHQLSYPSKSLGRTTSVMLFSRVMVSSWWPRATVVSSTGRRPPRRQ